MNRLAIISKERIQEELMKGLSGDYPDIYLQNLAQLTLLEKIFPIFKGAESVFHDDRGHHYSESILQHHIDLLKRARAVKKPNFRLAVAIHDAGKMKTRRQEADGKVKFLEHDEVGAKAMGAELRALKFSNPIISYVTRLITYHMKFHEMAKLEESGNDRSFRNNAATLFVELNEDMDFINDLMTLSQIDSGSLFETFGAAVLFREFMNTPKAVTGDDLLGKDELGADIFPRQIRGTLLERLRVIQLTQRKTRDQMLKEHLLSERNNLLTEVITIQLPLEVAKLLEVISMTNEVYIIGGAVRDWLLYGRLDGHDIDLVQNGDIDSLEQILTQRGYHMVTVGKSFGVIKVDLPSGTAIDIAQFRAETYESNSRKPSIRLVQTIEQDLSRRDITINAMAFRFLRTTPDGMATFKLIDPYEGRKDLEAGIIRMVGKPFDRISEDALRMQRVARMAAKPHPVHGTFRIDEETFEAIPKNLIDDDTVAS